MSHPLNIKIYIKLITEQPLSTNDEKRWYKSVKNTTPNGVITSLQTRDNEGNLQNICMIQRKTNKNEYIIPLTRNLTESEADYIANDWFVNFPDGDCDIEISSLLPEKVNIDPVESNDKQEHIDFITQSAIEQHTNWVRDKTNKRWRFGIYNKKNKTHPMIRPWSELPDKFKSYKM